MINTKKNPTKLEVKKMIREASFLTIADKKEWNSLIDSSETGELQQVHEFFVKAVQTEEKKKLQIVHEAGLGDEYKNKIKLLSDIFIKKAIKQQEEYAGETNENPENILKELDKI